MNFANIKTWTIQEGEVLQVKDANNARIIWSKGSTPGPDYSEPFYVENITNRDEIVRIVKSSSSAPTISIYKSEDRETWTSIGSTSTTARTISLTPGKKVYLRAKVNSWSAGAHRNTITGCSKIGGNVMSLIYGSDFTGQETTFANNTSYNLAGLNYGNAKLIDASKLLLPALVVNTCCYDCMFYYCFSLTSAPTKLPATTLSLGCYENMFTGCGSLITAPELPATTLIDFCYGWMFHNCSSLTTPPALPATTLADYCYYQMFQGCSALTSAPDLSAPTLVAYCYQDMFDGCSSLNYIKCLATDISATNSTYNWLNGVSSTGTFVQTTGVTWPSGVDGIPTEWTVQEV